MWNVVAATAEASLKEAPSAAPGTEAAAGVKQASAAAETTAETAAEAPTAAEKAPTGVKQEAKDHSEAGAPDPGL